MADYDCWPLWDISSTGTSNLDPELLPVSAELVVGLLGWAKKYDQTLNKSNPRESGFSTPRKHTQFVEEGWQLANKLAVELGKGWSVVYFDDLTGAMKPVVTPSSTGPSGIA